MEMIEIIFDTSFLKLRKVNNYSEFQFNKNYADFIDFLGANDLIEKYKICVPEIVLRELEKQLYDSFIEEHKIFNESVTKLKGLYLIKEIESINYKEILKNKIFNYIKSENIEVITIPINVNCFSYIIERAINKNKPFCGKEKESDKGFKDVIQWESIVSYAMKSKNKKFILFTKNKEDFDKKLELEFYERTNKRIDFFYEISDLQTSILNFNNLQSKNIIFKNSIESEIENGKLLEKVNEAIEKMCSLKMESVINYSDLIDLGNNYCQFTIFCNLEENKYVFLISCELNESKELLIDDISIMSQEVENGI